MTKQVIVRVVDENGSKFLAYADRDVAGMTIDTDTDFKLEELADLCDEQAEQSNAHDFVGSHRSLAALLFREVGREPATRIMRHIAEMGGLDGMNGVCTNQNAFAELGITEPWKNWQLPKERK